METAPEIDPLRHCSASLASLAAAGAPSVVAVHSHRALFAGFIWKSGVTLIRGWSNQARRIREPRCGLAPWQVRRALDRLEASLNEDISLGDLAREVGLSPFHFARSFKASVGAPPHRHQVTLRLERARTLLETTALSVREVAEHVGYSDPSYFARGFKKTFGVGPRQYRQHKRS